MISNPENCSVKQEMSIIFIYEKINTLRSYLLKVTQQAKSQSLHKILPKHTQRALMNGSVSLFLALLLCTF